MVREGINKIYKVIEKHHQTVNHVIQSNKEDSARPVIKRTHHQPIRRKTNGIWRDQREGEKGKGAEARQPR